jgi:hypothetical protein
MATEGTKFQINYKLSDGTLINLYAATVSELESGLADIAMNAANIKTTAIELGVGSAPAAAPSVASVAQAFNATPVSGDTPVCRHGAMNYREGTSARGPWKAHMCSAPKGAMDKCEPIFIR